MSSDSLDTRLVEGLNDGDTPALRAARLPHSVSTHLVAPGANQSLCGSIEDLPRTSNTDVRIYDLSKGAPDGFEMCSRCDSCRSRIWYSYGDETRFELKEQADQLK